MIIKADFGTSLNIFGSKRRQKYPNHNLNINIRFLAAERYPVTYYASVMF
jgi:hypothetical protein